MRARHTLRIRTPSFLVVWLCTSHICTLVESTELCLVVWVSVTFSFLSVRVTRSNISVLRNFITLGSACYKHLVNQVNCKQVINTRSNLTFRQGLLNQYVLLVPLHTLNIDSKCNLVCCTLLHYSSLVAPWSSSQWQTVSKSRVHLNTDGTLSIHLTSIVGDWH